MLLAGAGCIPANMAQQKLHMQGAASKLSAADQAMVKQNMPPGSGLPSPMSVSSHAVDHSGVPAANNNDVKGSKTVGMRTNIVTKGEPPKGMSPLGSMAASAIISSGISCKVSQLFYFYFLCHSDQFPFEETETYYCFPPQFLGVLF